MRKFLFSVLEQGHILFTNWMHRQGLIIYANPGPASLTSATVGSGGSWPDGYQIGSTSQSKVAAYGVSPGVVQRAGANQAAVSAGAVAGTLITMTASTVVPSSGTITANTISSIAVTMTTQGLLSAIAVDFLIVNKPSFQSNIGICGALVSTVSTVLVQYINPQNPVSGSPAGLNATGTAGEAYLVANLRGLASTVTLSPPPVAISTIAETLYTVTGVAVGDLLAIQKPTLQSYIGIVGMRVAANNQIGISFMNLSSAAVTPTASEAYTYVSLKQLIANSNIMVANVNVSAGVITAGIINTVTVTVTGLSVSTDYVLGASRVSTASVFAPFAGRVSAVNTLELSYLATGTISSILTASSTVTVSNFDILSVPFMRQTTAPPLWIQAITLTPTAVAALTTGEVTFAVSNITVSTVLWVNKPSLTANIGVVGCRAVSTNVIGITYVNNSANTITPPVEVYTIGNFPNMLGVTHSLQQQVQTAAVASVALTNEVRAALTALGFIAGA